MTKAIGRTRATKSAGTVAKQKAAAVSVAKTEIPATVPPASTVRRAKQGPARILPRTRPAQPNQEPPRVVAPTFDETLPEVAFAVGDVAVHPSHGVGRIASIEERSFGTSSTVVYVMDIIGTELKVLVPKPTAARVGLRPVMARAEAEEIVAILRTPEVAVTIQPWNRRFRAYSDMMATGSPFEVAKVMRDMQRLKADKELSFGERRLLEQSRTLLVVELGLALGTGEGSVDALIAEIFAPARP